ncbi:hypothetical protein [Shewanella oncorhynchi]|uniref:hypothetical protein n=1 Tax=Shewanella oncorhynchi TaxID=2726434 RepID=UPI003D7A9CD0
MDMPTPCPRCGEVVEFEDMVNHPNEFKTLVCEDCKDKIEEENNRGSETDSFGNVVEWHSDPDHGLIEFKANGEEVTAWCCEDDPEVSFHSFMEIWNKAQELTGKEKLEAITAERDQLAGKLAKLNHLAMIFVEDSEEIAEFFEASGGRNHLVLAKDVRELADEMADLLNDQAVENRHIDDIGIDRFTNAMRLKMAYARSKGRSGWNDKELCSGEQLAAALVEHLSKGNDGTFEDVANFAMMLHQRKESPMLLVDAVNDIRAKAIRQFVSDTNETGQLSFPDCQWLEQWLDEWLDEAAKGGE